MENETIASDVPQLPVSDEYEAPAIESVMTADELAREVHYAGAPDATLPIG